jgi:hypothetical protein
MVVARGTLVSALDIPSAVATTAAMARTVVTAGTVVTDGEADIGAIRATVGAGDGVLDLALGGRMGVGDGDTRMATSTALRITLPTPTPTRRIALRATGVLPMGAPTLRHQIPTRNPEATSRSLGNPRQELLARTTRFAMSPPLPRALRFCRLTRETPRRSATGSRTAPLPSGIRTFVLKCRRPCGLCGRCRRLHARGQSRPAATAAFRTRSGKF